MSVAGFELIDPCNQLIVALNSQIILSIDQNSVE